VRGQIEMKTSVTPGLRIKDLRISRGLTQTEFADLLRVTQSMISEWEGDKTGPSPEAFIRLGNLAPYPDNMWFWEQAGIDQRKLVDIAIEITKDAVRELIAPDVDFIVVKPFREAAEDSKREFVLPRGLVPNPLSTRFLIADEKSAGSVLAAGDIIVLGVPQTEIGDLALFDNGIILAEFGPRSETGNPDWPEGLSLGRLRIRCARQDRLQYVASIGPMADSEPMWSIYSREGKHVIGYWRHPGIPKEPAAGSPREQLLSEIRKIRERLSEIEEEGFKRGSTRQITEEENLLKKEEADLRNRLRHEEECERKKAEEEAAGQGPHSVRLKTGCKILGRAIAWFPGGERILEEK